MTDVQSPAILDVLRLQMDETAQQGMDLQDAEYAYQLQLQEALRASAPSGQADQAEILLESLPTSEAVVHNQLQVKMQRIFHNTHICRWSEFDLVSQTAALRQAAAALRDAQQASAIQRDMQQLAALEDHDLKVAHWLNTVSDDTWYNYGDTLQEPVSKEEFGTSLQVLLSFGAHTQGYRSAHAAVLKTCSGLLTPCMLRWCLHAVVNPPHLPYPMQHCAGKQIWQGSEAEDSNGSMHKVAAQLQGLHMGLLAAQHLGLQNIIVQAPNSRALLQVSPHSRPQWSQQRLCERCHLTGDHFCQSISHPHTKLLVLTVC